MLMTLYAVLSYARILNGVWMWIDGWIHTCAEVQSQRARLKL